VVSRSRGRQSWKCLWLPWRPGLATCPKTRSSNFSREEGLEAGRAALGKIVRDRPRLERADHVFLRRCRGGGAATDHPTATNAARDRAQLCRDQERETARGGEPARSGIGEPIAVLTSLAAGIRPSSGIRAYGRPSYAAIELRSRLRPTDKQRRPKRLSGPPEQVSRLFRWGQRARSNVTTLTPMRLRRASTHVGVAPAERTSGQAFYGPGAVYAARHCRVESA